MSNPAAYLVVGSPPRGGGTVAAASHVVKAVMLSYAWGTQPATAEIEYPGDTILTIGAALTLDLPNYLFYGIVEDSVVRTSAEGGQVVRVRFVDSRAFLWYDPVFCVFNRMEWKVVNGLRKRMFWHIYPGDIELNRRTWTNAPITGQAILNALFTAPTVETGWARSYHADLGTVRPLNIDAGNGRFLGDVVAEVTAKCGLAVTLGGGRYSLFWGRPGEGSAPTIPTTYKRSSVGIGHTGNPNRISVVGDRNMYQILDVPLVKDWSAGWQYFFDEDLFKDFVYRKLLNPADGLAFTTGDTEQLNRWPAAAYAARLTVKQFIDLAHANGSLAAEFSLTRAAFDDYRLYAGRSRMEMPALMYIRQVLYRCFRPSTFTLINGYGQTVAQADMRIVSENLVAVTHNITNGLMAADSSAPIESEGVAVAQGYQLFQDGFQNIRPEQVRLDDWVNTADLWQRLRFHVDDSGDDSEFVVFERPVILMSSLLTEIDGQVVLRAMDNVDAVPNIRAALTFEAERFNWRVGSGWRDAVEYVGGFHSEYVVQGGSKTELAFADGETATTKATALANALLNRPYSVVSGGWEYPGTTGQSLTGQVDRVLVRLDAGSGLVEEIDYTLGRRTNAFINEMDVTRKRQVETLFPGADAFRVEADQFERIGRVLRDNANVRKSFYAVMYESFGHGAPAEVWTPAAVGLEATTLPAGTPIWGDPEEKVAVLPENSATAHTVLRGLVIRDAEPAGKPCPCATRGRALARVMGPVEVGDALVRSDGNDHLAKTTGDSEEQLAGVRVLKEITDATVKLIPVEFGGGSGGGSDGPVWL